MANSLRRLPGDVRHPPFLPRIFWLRRGSSPPGAPDQGCKSRNVALASLSRKQIEKPGSVLSQTLLFPLWQFDFDGLIIHVLTRLLIPIGVIPNTAAFQAERGISRASEFSGIQRALAHYFFPGKSKTPLWTCAPSVPHANLILHGSVAQMDRAPVS